MMAETKGTITYCFEDFVKAADIEPARGYDVVTALREILTHVDKKAFPELIQLLNLIRTAKDYDVLFNAINKFLAWK